MPYIKTNPDNSIQDIEAQDNGGVFVEHELLIEINNHPTGYSVFDFIGGIVVLNVGRDEAYQLERAKEIYINQLIENEKVTVARERISAAIDNVNSAANMASLNALKNQ